MEKRARKTDREISFIRGKIRIELIEQANKRKRDKLKIRNFSSVNRSGMSTLMMPAATMTTMTGADCFYNNDSSECLSQICLFKSAGISSVTMVTVWFGEVLGANRMTVQ